MGQEGEAIPQGHLKRAHCVTCPGLSLCKEGAGPAGGQRSRSPGSLRLSFRREGPGAVALGLASLLSWAGLVPGGPHARSHGARTEKVGANRTPGGGRRGPVRLALAPEVTAVTTQCDCCAAAGPHPREGLPSPQPPGPRPPGLGLRRQRGRGFCRGA